MASDDLKTHALSSQHDFYDLLSVSPTASDQEIRKAYRKTALKYHPDKVGANPESLERFHLLQIAYDVLSDATVKELYDNARRAKEETKARKQAFDGRRRDMVDELERRESGALKRKREEADAEDKFERELRRLAEDGKRRRKEREEQVRKEAVEEQELERKQDDGEAVSESQRGSAGTAGVPDIDRSVTLRFLRNDDTAAVDQARVEELFSKFGAIDATILRDKKLKPQGAKHKQDYGVATLVYKSIVGAHAAVSDFERVRSKDDNYSIFESVDWTAGKEPEFIPKAHPSSIVNDVATPPRKPVVLPETPRNGDAGSNNGTAAGGGQGLRKVPSFSFKARTPKGPNSPSVDELTMMRLKNAEKRRLEEKIKREEAAAAGKD